MAINAPENSVPTKSASQHNRPDSTPAQDALVNPHILPEDEQLVSCEICLESVPLSEADISEAEEYVAYFCGLECYDIWRHKNQPPE